MIIASKKSHTNVFHEPDCPRLARIKADNRVTYPHTRDAFRSGLRPCKCCLLMRKVYLRNQRKIADFCGENSMKPRLEGNAVHVISRYDDWKIVSDDDDIRLFHKSSADGYDFDTFRQELKGYHLQASSRAHDIMGHLNYIRQHDFYRDSRTTSDYLKTTVRTHRDPNGMYIRHNPMFRHKEKKKAERRLKQEKRAEDLRRVYELLDRLAQATPLPV